MKCWRKRWRYWKVQRFRIKRSKGSGLKGSEVQRLEAVSFVVGCLLSVVGCLLVGVHGFKGLIPNLDFPIFWIPACAGMTISIYLLRSHHVCEGFI
jgi:hypothetical protein